MKSLRAPFTLLLPLASIAIWVLLVALPVTFIYTRMLRQTDASGAYHSSFVNVPRQELFPFATRLALIKQGEFVESLNRPADFVSLLIARLSPSWPSMWTPAHFSPREWNAIASPFYCLPFWWFAGLGIDALRRHRHPRWPTLLLGTLLCGCMLFLFLGMTFALSPAEKGGIALWGFLFWSLLLAVFPLAWIKARRNPKANTAA